MILELNIEEQKIANAVVERLELQLREALKPVKTKYLTVKSAALYLDVSTNYINSIITAGKLAYYQHEPYGKIWVTKEDLENYVSKNKSNANADTKEK